jgi:hypothetical protein
LWAERAPESRAGGEAGTACRPMGRPLVKGAAEGAGTAASGGHRAARPDLLETAGRTQLSSRACRVGVMSRKTVMPARSAAADCSAPPATQSGSDTATTTNRLEPTGRLCAQLTIATI